MASLVELDETLPRPLPSTEPSETDETEPRPPPSPEPSESDETESDETDEDVSDLSQSPLSWSNSSECHPDGKYPSVCINNSGVVVAMFNGGKNNLWYRVGKWKGKHNGRIVWGESKRYDKGLYPSVTINDDGAIDEVHQSQWRQALFYRVGTVDKDNATITWAEGSSMSTRYGSGGKPSVALNNKGEFGEVHTTRDNSTF